MKEEDNSVQLRHVKLVVENADASSDSNYHSQPGSTLTMLSEPDMKFGKDNPAYVPDTDAVEKQANGKVKKPLVEEDDYESSDEEHEDDYLYGNAWSRGIMRLQTGIFGAFKKYNEMVWTCIYVCLLTLFMAYFIASMLYRFGDEGSIRLLVMTILLSLFIASLALHSFCGDKITFYYYWSKIDRETRHNVSKWFHIICCILLALGALIYVIVEIALKTPSNLISLSGMVFFILFFYVFSHNPARYFK